MKRSMLPLTDTVGTLLAAFRLCCVVAKLDERRDTIFCLFGFVVSCERLKLVGQAGML